VTTPEQPSSFGLNLYTKGGFVAQYLKKGKKRYFWVIYRCCTSKHSWA